MFVSNVVLVLVILIIAILSFLVGFALTNMYWQDKIIKRKDLNANKDDD